MTSSGTRALRALQVVNASAEPIGVTAIAAALDTLPGTAFRSLDALERADFVSRYRASTLYQVGPAAIRLRQTLHAQFPLRNLATPYLRRLAVAAGDTVSLTVPVGWHALRLVVVAGSNSVRSNVATGLNGLLDRSLGGRVILAGLSAAELEEFRRESAALNDGAGTTVDAASLAQIAARGLALEPVEGSGRAAIGMPVRHGGDIVAAVSIDGPVVSLTGDDPATETDPAEWQAIVSEIEQAIAHAGDFQPLPFAHLDRGAVSRAMFGFGSDLAGSDE